MPSRSVAAGPHRVGVVGTAHPVQSPAAMSAKIPFTIMFMTTLGALALLIR
jgi:hypothetical protein